MTAIIGARLLGASTLQPEPQGHLIHRVAQVTRRGLPLAGALALCIVIAGPALAGIPASPPPVLASDDAYALDEDTPLAVAAPGVLENDTTTPAACVAALDTSSLVGQVTLGPDGSLLYTPTADFNGATSFTYGLMAVGAEGCPGPYEDEATVALTINAVNDAPTAVADAFQFIWGQTLNIAGPGVLANDSDPDGDDLTALKATNPAHGVLTLAANGGFSYTPAAAACPGRQDAFSYRASDGDATSAVRIVLLNPAVLPCPTPPPAATPTPSPSPTPPPTASPEPSPSPPPEESPTVEPEPSASPDAPGASPSVAPSPSPAPGPAGDDGSVSLPVLLVLVLLGVLLAFGAAYYVPRWLEARRTGEDLEA